MLLTQATALARGGPSETFRAMLQPTGRGLDLENSTCQRTLCADGSVSESVMLATGNDGREATDEDLDQWIATFPIEPFSTKLCIVPLPSDMHAPAETAPRSLLVSRKKGGLGQRALARNATSIDASARTCADSSHCVSTFAPAETRRSTTSHCLPRFPAEGS